MEDVCTVKVKTKSDPRNLYPSERRYSASTVCGLALIHISLAIISLILTLLTIIKSDDVNSVLNATIDNSTDNLSNNTHLLPLAPSLVTAVGLTAGLTAVLASVRWYVDRNIKWLLVSTVISSAVCFAAVPMILIWIIIENIPNDVQDVFVLKQNDILIQNNTHFVIHKNATQESKFTNNVLSVNILICTVLELLLSVLSVKIAYKGMRNVYNIDEKRGNCQVITLKGDKNPNGQIKKIFLAHSDNGFYLRNEMKHKDTNSEFNKERMMNFLNSSFERESNPDLTPSVQSDAKTTPHLTPIKRITPQSWGDSPDHTVYNQNTFNFEKIFKYRKDEI